MLPFIAGILLQWHLQIQVTTLGILFFVSTALLAFTFFLPAFEKFRYSLVNGFIIFFIFLSLGAGLAWHKDARNNKTWVGNLYKEKDTLLVVLQEPLTEKENSYKGIASVISLIKKNKAVNIKGKIIVYFQKDSSLLSVSYGSRIIFRKPLQEIKNPGNPGGFNYKRYCLFQNISHQVYLESKDFEILAVRKENRFKKFLFRTRDKILGVLRTYIKGEKEHGLAEALLIGYKDDLDKNLVQSYSNTGVVHIIAISGLHLGLIYWLLLQLFRPLKNRKLTRILRPFLIIAMLWLFSLLAGAPPSVLRSALMFTCIVLGESFSRKTSLYNSLALSAFLLLCHNPYWLWDTGFQLSYSAVLSIVIFMKPVYNLLYIKNRLLDYAWKLNAVTISAQFLTLPICLYQFHQFPVFFLISNFVAVPLSGIILFGEIMLCVFAYLPMPAEVTGKILQELIGWLNIFIEKIDGLPYSVIGKIQVSILQVLLLFVFVAACSYWIMEKQKAGIKIGLFSFLVCIVLRGHSFYEANEQRKMIVYNITRHQAIDFIDGRSFLFLADSFVKNDEFLLNFHINPSRIKHRATIAKQLHALHRAGNYVQLGDSRIIVIDSNKKFILPDHPVKVNAIVLSHNPKVFISELNKIFQPGLIIFDSSNPPWKMKYWEKDCDSLGIPYYNVRDNGAIVIEF